MIAIGLACANHNILLVRLCLVAPGGSGWRKLDERKLLDWEEAFADATLITARNKELRSRQDASGESTKCSEHRSMLNAKLQEKRIYPGRRHSSLREQCRYGYAQKQGDRAVLTKMTFLRHSRDTVMVRSLYSIQKMNPSAVGFLSSNSTRRRTSVRTTRVAALPVWTFPYEG
jgi:hypothetical protein